MNFLIFRDFSRLFLNFYEFKLIYFELNSIYIYIYRVLTWQLTCCALPHGGIWTRHVATRRCSHVCESVRASECARVRACEERDKSSF